jgi:serine/threonine protein kinase
MPLIPPTPNDTPAGNRREDYGPGDVLDGRYRIESILGSGGMGVVYRVTQMFVNKEFALKTLIKDQISEVKIRRFQQEARTVFALDHPNIIAVKDFGIIEDMTPFLVMELIDGDTLAERMKRSGRLTLEEAIPIFVQTCFGLGYAHDQGIIHRDIKPSNIMLLNGIASGVEGSVKIVDFGIAKFAQNDGGDIQALTRTGEIFGSPFYMSPEQCAGERVDYRADIYSLGCVLYEALTGTPPCVGESALSTMMQHQTLKPPSLKEASMGLEFPPELELIVAKMLDKTPEKRYQKLGIVAHHLGALVRGGLQPSVLKEQIVESVKPAEKATRGEGKTASFYTPKLLALLGAVALVAAVPAGTVGYFFGRAQSHDTKNVGSPKSQNVNDAHTLNPQISDNSDTPTKQQKTSDGDSLKQPIEKYQRPELIPSVPPTPITAGARENTVFSFPKDISVGILKVDQQKPISVEGDKSVNRKSKLTFYTRHASRGLPQLLDKFRDDDLNGLEAVFEKPEDVIGRVKNWKRLQELSFFDSLIKAMPRYEIHDETPIRDDLLPEIDKLSTLTSLGLCGPRVTGDSIAKMSLLRSLNTIKLKSIKNPEPLLEVLPRHNNIEEVWLIGQDTDNHQLELLTRMENLKSLTIRRSKLGTDSLPIFSRMKKLNNLTLDRNDWSEQDKQKFKKKFPNCRFEPVVDVQYWYVLPVTTFKPQIAQANTKDKKSEEPKAKASEIDSPSELNDSSFKDFDKLAQPETNTELDVSRLFVQELVEFGASSKEISVISKFPFDLISPYEKEFRTRLSVYLEQPTKWSHR